MGLEAMSRGAARVFLIERHFPTVKIIKENVRVLDEQMNATIASSDSFFWSRKFLKDKTNWPSEPWLVFCCPPYDLFVQQTELLLEMINGFLEAAPPESIIVVESDNRFDIQKLPGHQNWNVRQYTPALISVFKKFDDEPQTT